jgi:aminopeptidase N
MSDPEVSNSSLYATARGFWQPDQPACDPYVSRFFEEIAGTARLRSGWVLSRLAELCYPRTAVRRTTVEATEQLLRRDDLHAGIRRGVVDAGDDLRRAVVARERFGLTVP